MATLATLLVLLLLMGLFAMLGAQVMHREQMSSDALVQGHQRQSLQESGLDWGLHLLNSPGLGTDCLPAAKTEPGPAFAQHLSLLDERGRWQIRAPWQGQGFSCSVEDAVWRCRCPHAADVLGPDRSASAAASFADGLPRFNVQFQGRERLDAAPWHRRTLRLMVQSCAEGQTRCEFPATPASSPLPSGARTQLVALSSALAQAPGSALIGASTVDLHDLALSHSGLALAPDPDSVWVVQAGGEILGADGHVQGPPGSTATRWVRPMEPELALAPEDFFKRYFALSTEQYRGRAGLSALDCRGVPDCSVALQERVNAGHAWLWVQGPARLSKPMSLGSRESPVLILFDSDLDIDTALQLTGLLYSHGHTRLHASGAGLRIDGALISAGPALLSGRVQIVHSAAIVRRLADLRGTWIRLPGGWAS